MSVRTHTSIDVVIRRGRRVVMGRAIDLSQTGILVEHAALRRNDKPMELSLELPNGPTRVLVRPVRKHRGCIGYAFVDLTDRDQSQLTDYLFTRLAEDSTEPPRSGVRNRLD